MESPVSNIFCNMCNTRLKRQVLGSNIFYYCRNCGCLSSEAHLTKYTGEFHAQAPVSAQKTVNAQETVNAQKSIIEA